MRFGAPMARLDVVTAGKPTPASSADELAPTVAIILSCEHAISDGVSLSVIAHELFSFLAEVRGCWFKLCAR